MNLKDKLRCVDTNSGEIEVCDKHEIKKAVLEFENILKKAKEDNCLSITTEDTLLVFKDIFGDWEK